MKTVFALATLMTLSTAFADVHFRDTADLDQLHSYFKISYVRFANLPSKTETRTIPGCRPGNSGRVCTETTVLERTAVVEVTVSYKEGIFHDSDPRFAKGSATFNLHPEAFSAEALADLKTIGIFQSNARKFWAAKNLELQVQKLTRNIQVIDMRTSTLCPFENEPYPRPGCVEDIHYKPGTKTVNEVKILVK